MGVVFNEYGRITLIRLRLILVAILLSLSAGTVASEERIALVIGNANYEALNSLANPVRDAEAMSETLSGLGFRVYLATNMTQDDMGNAVTLFAQKAQTADTILIYYAGHGGHSEGQTAVFGTDFDPDQSTPFAISNFIEPFSNFSAKKLWLFDNCLDVGVSNSATPPQVNDLPANSIAAFSTTMGKPAYDGTGQHSLFTGALLDEMVRKDTPIEETLKRVRSEVYKNSAGEQLPQSRSTMIYDLYLAPTQNTDSNENQFSSLQVSELLETGFSSKPILEDFAAGLTVSSDPKGDPSHKLQAQFALCQSLQEPLPAACLRLFTKIQSSLN